MKKIVYILLLIGNSAFSQIDSLKIEFSEEKGELNKTTFVETSAYNQTVGEPIMQLWKLQIGSMLNSRSHNENYEYNLSLGYERMLNENISINLLFDRWRMGEGWKRENYSLIVEPRFYLKKKE